MARAGEGLTVIRVPAPPRAGIDVLATLRRISGRSPHGVAPDDGAAPDGEVSRRPRAVGWFPPRGPELVGSGATAVLSGPVDSLTLGRDARRLLASISLDRHEAAPPSPPRLVGGFAFGSRFGLGSEDSWSRFGPGLLVLPRWTYARTSGSAWLSLAIRGPLETDEQERALIEWAEVTDSLERTPPAAIGPRLEPERAPVAPFDSAADEGIARNASARNALAWFAAGEGPSDSGEARREWKRRVEAILGEIEVGGLSKVVAARSAVSGFKHPRDPALVMRALVARFGRCTGFYLELGGGVFLGATPERLVRKAGGEVYTEALAGSAAPGRADDLRRSSKDRREHELVRADVVSRLEPLCDSVRCGGLRPLDLPNIVHLRTPIRAKALPDTEILDLVAALHPTPAVGGVPAGPALRWIEAHEPENRGWYAAPFGWLDAAGDGEFVVALRCALLLGTTARLYAGAGIVRGSDPEQEWWETEAKLQAVRAALAVAGRRGGQVHA